MALKELARWSFPCGDHRMEIIIVNRHTDGTTGREYIKVKNLTRVHEATLHHLGVEGSYTNLISTQSIKLVQRDDKNSKILEMVMWAYTNNPYYMIKARGF